jgi:uncharacterized protein YabE (DUF348 family)
MPGSTEMRARRKVAQAALVAVLAASAVAYGALEKHVTVRVEGSTIRVGTFADTVSEALHRADITLGPGDRVLPSLGTHLSEGMLIEVRRAKPITLLLNGMPRQVIVTGLTVDEVIQEMKLSTSLSDFVGAPRSERIVAGMVLVYRNAIGLEVVHDGKTDRVITNAATVRDVLADLDVTLGKSDIVSPSVNTLPRAGLVVQVVRVGIHVETSLRKIAFTTVAKGDPYMERGTHETVRGGRAGLEQVRERVTYKDGRPVSRVLLAARTIRAPVTKILAIGTGPRCICTRGVQTGDGTWYRAPTLTAAHPTLPFGTVVRVTNLANGKTVTVTIRDRGPTGPGRVIDLSDDAFARIADLNEGVIRVRLRW